VCVGSYVGLWVFRSCATGSYGADRLDDMALHNWYMALRQWRYIAATLANTVLSHWVIWSWPTGWYGAAQLIYVAATLADTVLRHWVIWSWPTGWYGAAPLAVPSCATSWYDPAPLVGYIPTFQINVLSSCSKFQISQDENNTLLLNVR
jgi:hypothetical protein